MKIDIFRMCDIIKPIEATSKKEHRVIAVTLFFYINL